MLDALTMIALLATPAPRAPLAKPAVAAPKPTATPRPTPRPTPTPSWPTVITVYAGDQRISTGPEFGFEAVQLPIINLYTGVDGCWLAALSHNPRGAAYQLGPDAWVHGLVRVQGSYDDDGQAKPKGFKGTPKKLIADPALQWLMRQTFPAIANDAWASGETYLFTPLLESGN